MSEPTSAAESWMRQWKAAGPELEEIRRRELRQLTDEQALIASEAVLSIVPTAPIPRERVEWSGLVTQQALFHRGAPR
ncbi:hypothetical protein FBQ97_06010 [Acidobacteria bacterium ACD]|nr:MAG: hypothetical protein EDX89_11170 [Acidobacteriota bacterium]MDL1949357.1 hypothetical protein [Acidobacteria bacterium ACD]